MIGILLCRFKGYHFKLANVILQMAVKEFFETHF